jgi:hypothetical protein
VAKALAEFECGGETLASEFAFAEPHVGKSTEVEAVGRSPGVLAVGMFRAVERIAGILESFARISSREVCFGERNAEVDGVLPEAAGVRQENTGFGFGDSLWVVGQLAVEFAGGVEATQLEIDYSGTAREGTSFLKVKGGFTWIVRKEKSREEGITNTNGVIIVVAGRALPVVLCLDERSTPVTAKQLGHSLQSAWIAIQEFVYQFGSALKIG